MKARETPTGAQLRRGEEVCIWSDPNELTRPEGIARLVQPVDTDCGRRWEIWFVQFGAADPVERLVHPADVVNAPACCVRHHGS